MTSIERVWLSYRVSDQKRAWGMSGGNITRVRLRPVEELLVRVHEGDEVPGADAGEAHGHGGGEAGVAVEEQGAQGRVCG